MTALEPGLPAKVEALNEGLAGADIPFAFGGAMALAYYGEPRTTIDVDINIFLGPDEFDRVARVLTPLDISANAEQLRTLERDGRVRLWWGRTAVDLFFAYDAFHFNAATRTRRVPFAASEIPILAAEDLLTCKVIFNRSKDWIDIDQMLLLTAGSLDIDDVRLWLDRIVGPDDDRRLRFDRAVATILGPGYSA